MTVYDDAPVTESQLAVIDPDAMVKAKPVGARGTSMRALSALTSAGVFVRETTLTKCEALIELMLIVQDVEAVVQVPSEVPPDAAL